MPTMDEYLTRPLGVRLERLRSTPTELARRLEGRDAAALARRPGAGGWSAAEILCHLRDVEELFLVRFQTILAADDPQILTLGAASEALAAWGIGGGIGPRSIRTAGPRTGSTIARTRCGPCAPSVGVGARSSPCSTASPRRNGGAAASTRRGDA